jgi:hypothetical protein
MLWQPSQRVFVYEMLRAQPGRMIELLFLFTFNRNLKVLKLLIIRILGCVRLFIDIQLRIIQKTIVSAAFQSVATLFRFGYLPRS